MTKRPPRTPPAITSPARWIELAGIAAAVVLAFVVNVLGARHFKRWDWTETQRWSLSPASIETLRALDASGQKLDVWAVAGHGDPLDATLRPLVAAYVAASSRLELHWIDPDRDTVELVDLQRRFGLEAGRTEDGRVATDAAVIVARGDKHWFLTQADLFEASDDVHVKPREERALTQAIREVMGGERLRLCFTVGHGELGLEPGKDEHEWLGGVKDLLAKDNYELTSVDTTDPEPPPDASGAAAPGPFAGCAVVIVAGPHAPFAPAESRRLQAWLLQGGNLLAAIGPIDASTDTGLAPVGLDEVLGPFGIGLDDVLVHDLEPSVAIPETHGEGFFVAARPHAVTASLVAGGPDGHPPRVAAFFARSLRHVTLPGARSVPASELLVTSGEAFAKTSLVGAASWGDAPPRDPTDLRGPFVVAMAAERPPLSATAGHGPRVVVLGSRFGLAEDNWHQPRALHGMAFFVDSALSWLAARPSVVDVPERADLAVAMRISEEGRAEVRRYVLVLMPLAAVLLAVAVWAWRRAAENTPYVPLSTAAPSAKSRRGKGAS